jgi:hypothetical protein
MEPRLFSKIYKNERKKKKTKSKLTMEKLLMFLICYCKKEGVP